MVIGCHMYAAVDENCVGCEIGFILDGWICEKTYAKKRKLDYITVHHIESTWYYYIILAFVV